MEKERTKERKKQREYRNIKIGIAIFILYFGFIYFGLGLLSIWYILTSGLPSGRLKTGIPTALRSSVYG